MSTPRTASRPTPTAGARPAARPSGAARADADVVPNRWAFRLFVLAVVASVVPIVVAAVRAIGRGWIPIGDDALFGIRSLDVFNQHLPLLGLWSGSSQQYGINLNHPGPLLFDALAVPVKVFGPAVGLSLGIAALNSLAVVGVAVFAYRRGGVLLGTLAAVATATLAWSMGSEMLYEPWQPHSMMLPFLLLLFVVWSAACGDLVALPFAVGVGSFVVETHLSYSILVTVLVGWAAVGVLIWLARERRRAPEAWPALRHRAQRIGIVSVVVLALAWVQPVIEEFTASGSGNLTRLAHAARASHVRITGFRLGARLVASVVSLPPLWFRPSVSRTFAGGWQPPSLALAVVSLVVVVALLGVCVVDGRRRGDRTSVLLGITGGLVFVVAIVTAAKSPVTALGAWSPHVLRWLWPIATFLFFVVAAAALRHIAERRPRVVAMVGGLTLLAVVMAALNLPNYNSQDGFNGQQYAIPTVKSLDAQLGALAHHGPLLIDDVFVGFVFEPYGAPILLEMQRRGIPFVTRDPSTLRQLGPQRRFTGHNATVALLLRTGSGTLTTPAGSRRVATGEGLSPADQRERATLERAVIEYLSQSGLPLNHRGELAVQRGEVLGLSATGTTTPDPAALISSGALATLVTHGELRLDPTWARRFGRFAQLQQAWNVETVGLYLAPITSSSGSLSLPAGG